MERLYTIYKADSTSYEVTEETFIEMKDNKDIWQSDLTDCWYEYDVEEVEYIDRNGDNGIATEEEIIDDCEYCLVADENIYYHDSQCDYLYFVDNDDEARPDDYYSLEWLRNNAILCACGRWFRDEDCDKLYGSSEYHNLADLRNGDYTTCDNCGCWIHYDDIIELHGTEYCPDCAEEIEEEKSTAEYWLDLQSYGKTSADMILKTEKDRNPKLLLGIELEVDEGNPKALYYKGNEMKPLYKICERKSDGSLSDNGFEMAFYPQTINYLNDFPYHKYFDIIRSCDYLSHDTSTCGLHVHASRKGLGKNRHEQEITIHKILTFIECNLAQIERFSRRNTNRWAENNNVLIDDKKRVNEKHIEHFKWNNSNRYRVLNLLNSHTIEFRLPKGTLNAETFKANAQFFYNLCSFCKKNSLEKVKKATLKTIVEYRKYEELTNYYNKKFQ